MKAGDPMSDPAKMLVVHEAGTSVLTDPETLSSLIVPAIFSRAKYLGPSQTLHHLPFLSWLVEALKPRRVVEIGLNHGVSYFATCQAAERLDCLLDCTGIGEWSDGVPEDLARYNDEQYQEFSSLLSMSGSAAADRFEPGSVDLLILGRPMSEIEKLLEAGWQDKISARGIVLIHGSRIGDAEAQADLTKLRQAYDSFEFPHGDGLLVLGVGQELPPRITKFLDHGLTPDRAEHLRRVFRRLGRSQATEGRLAVLEAELASHETKRQEQVDAELLKRDFALAEKAAQIETLEGERAAWEQQHARLQTEIETLSLKVLSQADVRTIKDLTAERDRLMRVIELRDTALSESVRQKSEAKAECEGLAALLKDAKSAESRQSKQIAKLEGRLKEAQRELGELVGLAEENERLRMEVERMASDIDGLRGSTSWKLTAPMRAVVLKLRG